jgi:uncharacterized membrane protein YphA (DoxX/SURF4 family)
MNRFARLALGLIVLAFGFFCLNYTNGFGIAHHAEWANAHGYPPPSYAIFVTGAALEALGAIVFGHALASRKAATR